VDVNPLTDDDVLTKIRRDLMDYLDYFSISLSVL